MLGHRGLHAVWISTSTDVHASQSLAAIAKGIHTLCEKPLSTDLAEVSPSQLVGLSPDHDTYLTRLAGAICGGGC
jgi:predicted dehydrogenase